MIIPSSHGSNPLQKGLYFGEALITIVLWKYAYIYIDIDIDDDTDRYRYRYT